MTRVLFIDAIKYWEKGREVEASIDHPGLLYLASYIRQQFGFDYFDIKIIYRDIERFLKNFKPHIVGISSVTQNFNIAKKYAKIVKSAGFSVVVGGAHISALPCTLSEEMDVGVIGEGEETIVELLKLYETEKTFSNKKMLYQIKGIVYKDGDKYIQTEPRPLITSLDKIPFPARDLAYINKYNKGAGIFTSRGCPYKCRFCFSSHHWKKIRYFSPGYVVKEIKELVEKYHMKHISIYDDLFISDKRKLVKIIRLLKKEKIPEFVSFHCNVRGNHIDNETAILLKEMNVSTVFIGVESGTQRILAYLKGDEITVEQNKMAIRILEKYDIRCIAGIIIGSPAETREEILDTLRFIKESKLHSFYIFNLTPWPGTPLWGYALKRGLVSNDMDWGKLRLEFSEIPDKAIVLSETLTRDELFRLYRLFRKEKWSRDFKAIFYPLSYFTKHPLLFYRKAAVAIKKGYVPRLIISLYLLVKSGGFFFGYKEKNHK